MTKTSQKQKGIGLVSIVIFVAVIFSLLNVYAYYNPNFSLARYSPLNYLKAKRDETRIKDLKKLEKAIIAYFETNRTLPTSDGWCGRFSSLLHPDFATEIKPYLEEQELPHDPLYPNTDKDYFYYRVDKHNYILMAVLEVPKENTTGKYNYEKCHDWPGNDVYNYRLTNVEENL